MTDKRQTNLDALAPLSNMDANTKHIFSRVKKRFEAMRLIGIFLKRERADKQKAESNLELYLDDWVFHHGPITKENAAEVVADCLDRVRQQQRTVQALSDDAIDPDGMMDFPI